MTQITDDGVMSFNLYKKDSAGNWVLTSEPTKTIAPGQPEQYYSIQNVGKLIIRNPYVTGQLDSYNITYEYDARVPQTTITTPVTNESSTISGMADETTAKPGDTVNVYGTDGQLIGSTTVGADLSWTIDVPAGTTLEPGKTVTAEVLNPASGQGGKATKVVADTRVPNTTMNPVKDTDTSVSGEIGTSGKPGDRIVVTDAAGNKIGETKVQADGTWRIDNLPVGTLKPNTDVKAVITNPLNNESTSASQKVTDTRVPDVVIDGVDESSTAITGEVGPNGQPGDEITVVDSHNRVIGTTKVDQNGSWSLPIPEGTSLAYGDKIQVTIKNPANNKTGSNETRVTDKHLPDVTLNPVKDTDRVISGTAGTTGKPGDQVVVTDADGRKIGETTVKDDGTWSLPVPEGVDLQPNTKVTATATNPKDPSQTPAVAKRLVEDTRKPSITVDPIKDSDAIITGTAGATGKPGDQVVVKDAHGKVIGETKVQADGTWTISNVPAGSLEANTKVTATITNPNNPGDPTLVEVPVADTRVPGATIDPVEAGADTLTGQTSNAQPGDIITVTDNAGNIIGSPQVQADGTWTLPVPQGTSLNPGDMVKVHITNPNNGQGASDQTIVGQYRTPDVTINDVQSDATSISGTAGESGLPGDRIVVTDANGRIIGKTSIKEDGTWSIPLPNGMDLQPGAEITATATNPKNGQTALAKTLVIDAANPVVTIDHVHTNDQQITGSGTVGGIVTVTDEVGRKLGATVVDVSGHWTIKVPSDYVLKDGTRLVATITNRINGKTAIAKTVVVTTLVEKAREQTTPAELARQAAQAVKPTKVVTKQTLAKTEHALPKTGERAANALTVVGVIGLMLGMLGRESKKRREN